MTVLEYVNQSLAQYELIAFYVMERWCIRKIERDGKPSSVVLATLANEDQLICFCQGLNVALLSHK